MAVQLPKPAKRSSGSPNKDEKAMWLDNFLRGWSPSEIGMTYRRDAEVVRSALSDMGYSPDRFRTEDEIVEQWPALYGKDWTLAEIAKEFETSSGTVRYHLARMGTKIKHPAYYQGEKRKARRKRKKRKAA